MTKKDKLIIAAKSGNFKEFIANEHFGYNYNNIMTLAVKAGHLKLVQHIAHSITNMQYLELALNYNRMKVVYYLFSIANDKVKIMYYIRTDYDANQIIKIQKYIDKVTEEELSEIFGCCKLKKSAILDYLLTYCVKNKKCIGKILHYSVLNNNIDYIKLYIDKIEEKDLEKLFSIAVPEYSWKYPYDLDKLSTLNYLLNYCVKHAKCIDKILSYSVISNKIEFVKQYIHKDYNPHLLCIALQNNNIDMIKLLLSYNYSQCRFSDAKCSIIYYAKQNIEFYKLFCKYIKINTYTLVDIILNHTDTLKYILENDKEKIRTAFPELYILPKIEILELFRINGFDLNLIMNINNKCNLETFKYLESHNIITDGINYDDLDMMTYYLKYGKKPLNANNILKTNNNDVFRLILDNVKISQQLLDSWLFYTDKVKMLIYYGAKNINVFENKNVLKDINCMKYLASLGYKPSIESLDSAIFNFFYYVGYKNRWPSNKDVKLHLNIIKFIIKQGIIPTEQQIKEVIGHDDNTIFRYFLSQNIQITNEHFIKAIKVSNIEAIQEIIKINADIHQEFKESISEKVLLYLDYEGRKNSKNHRKKLLFLTTDIKQNDRYDFCKNFSNDSLREINLINLAFSFI